MDGAKLTAGGGGESSLPPLPAATVRYMLTQLSDCFEVSLAPGWWEQLDVCSVSSFRVSFRTGLSVLMSSLVCACAAINTHGPCWKAWL